MVKGGYGAFSLEDYELGLTAQEFFGRALNNFGVRELLDAFIQKCAGASASIDG